MNTAHSLPEIYNPQLTYQQQHDLLLQVGRAMSEYRGMTFEDFRQELIQRLNVDIEEPGDTSKMLLLYEYLFEQKPAVCSAAVENRRSG